MSTLRVSIITPSYNQGEYIGATVESILSQDYPHVEHLVMDGGSTDSTVGVLQGFNDERLVWLSEPDRGQSHAINKGLARATGDLLTYLNSDDTLLPGAVRFAVETFTQRPALDVFYGDRRIIDGQGNTIRTQHGEPFDLKRALTGRLVLPQQGSFWRRSVTDHIGPFDERLHYTMDFDYYLRMAAAGITPEYIPGEWATFRFHEASKTISQPAAFWDDWERTLDTLYGLPDLPEQFHRLRPEAYGYIRKLRVEELWRAGQRAEARPHLRKLLTGRDVPFRQRVLALAMLTDSHLHTPFTAWMQSAYSRLKS